MKLTFEERHYEFEIKERDIIEFGLKVSNLISCENYSRTLRCHLYSFKLPRMGSGEMLSAALVDVIANHHKIELPYIHSNAKKSFVLFSFGVSTTLF